MYFIVFCVLLSLSIILVTLGLFRNEHTELPLAGFAFMFLLSLCLLNGGVSVKTGTFTSSNFTYTQNSSGLNQTLLTESSEAVTDLYSPIQYHGILQHVIGLFLAIASIGGFVICMSNMRRII